MDIPADRCEHIVLRSGKRCLNDHNCENRGRREYRGIMANNMYGLKQIASAMYRNTYKIILMSVVLSLLGLTIFEPPKEEDKAEKEIELIENLHSNNIIHRSDREIHNISPPPPIFLNDSKFALIPLIEDFVFLDNETALFPAESNNAVIATGGDQICNYIYTVPGQLKNYTHSLKLFVCKTGQGYNEPAYILLQHYIGEYPADQSSVLKITERQFHLLFTDTTLEEIKDHLTIFETNRRQEHDATTNETISER